MALAPIANAGNIKTIHDLKCHLDLTEMIRGEESPIKELTKELNQVYVEYANARLILEYFASPRYGDNREFPKKFTKIYGSNKILQELESIDLTDRELVEDVVRKNLAITTKKTGDLVESIQSQISSVFNRCIK